MRRAPGGRAGPRTAPAPASTRCCTSRSKSASAGGQAEFEQMRQVNVAGHRTSAGRRGSTRCVPRRGRGQRAGGRRESRAHPARRDARAGQRPCVRPPLCRQPPAGRAGGARAREARFRRPRRLSCIYAGPDDPVGAPANKLIKSLITGKLRFTLRSASAVLDVRDFADGCRAGGGTRHARSALPAERAQRDGRPSSAAGGRRSRVCARRVSAPPVFSVSALVPRSDWSASSEASPPRSRRAFCRSSGAMPGTTRRGRGPNSVAAAAAEAVGRRYRAIAARTDRWRRSPSARLMKNSGLSAAPHTSTKIPLVV